MHLFAVFKKIICLFVVNSQVEANFCSEMAKLRWDKLALSFICLFYFG